MRSIDAPALPVRQRRPRQSAVNVVEDTPRRDARKPTHSTTLLRALTALVPLFVLAAMFHFTFSRHPAPQHTPEPDDEAGVTAYRIEATGTQFSTQQAPTCMPTVTRSDGEVEYVSNAAKSWYLAHNGVPPPLYVYDMDADTQPTRWRSRVGASQTTWLKQLRLDLPSVTPQRYTLNDSVTRVKWRSKEALDYSGVLRDCARIARLSPTTTDDTVILVVQDDVLFRREITTSREWAANALADSGRSRVNRAGREVPVRTCSASLFDLGDGVGDEPQGISNLVARYWRVGEADAFADYIERHFEDAPVDWLADRWCRRRRATVPVLRPNPVRHRGRVSSFIENKREELLT